MPRKKAGFKCAKCGQSFGLAMHLGRHMSARHGQVPAAAKRAAGAKKGRGKGAGRAGRRIGRPGGVAGKLGLRNFSLEQLIDVIAAAKEEAGRRIAEYQDVMK